MLRPELDSVAIAGILIGLGLATAYAVLVWQRRFLRGFVVRELRNGIVPATRMTDLILVVHRDARSLQRSHPPHRIHQVGQSPAVGSSSIAVVGALMVAACLGLVSCASIRIDPIREVKPPGPGWSVYTSSDTGVAVALPPGWQGFDLRKDLPVASHAASAGDTDLEARLRDGLPGLVKSGVFFFACDPQSGDARPAVAYALKTQPITGDLDEFLTKQAAAQGTPVLDQHHVSGALGDMVTRRLRTGPTIQIQFVLSRPAGLDIFSVEFPVGALDRYSMIADQMGVTFTPLH